jgi:hypothetical protein
VQRVCSGVEMARSVVEIGLLARPNGPSHRDVSSSGITLRGALRHTRSDGVGYARARGASPR